MSKETTERRATRLMKQDRLTSEEIQDLVASADVLARRSRAASSIAREMHQAARAMQREAQRLRTLANQVSGAAAADVAALPDKDNVQSIQRGQIKVFK